MCEFYTHLHERLIIDVAGSYESLAVKQESNRDVAVLRRRVRSEGLSFLTKVLPKLAKELDRALSQGTLFAPRGFVTKPRSTIPKFLGWLFERVFSDQGHELSSACPRAVRDLRQILYFLYKLEVPYTHEQETTCLLGFEATDSGLPDTVASDDVIVHARNFVTNVCGLFCPYDVVPKHGPGSVATGEENHEKHRFSRLYQAIEREYPFTEYFVYSLDHPCLDPSYLRGLQVQEAGTAKVVLVPKDSRGPRIISCEPLEYQWIQQGLGGALQRHLEKHWLTSGHVNFTDQTINQRLALEGSISRRWVTLDMKEASDRVSVALVKELFRDCPTLLNCLLATRTPATRLPNGNVVVMKKFAPMGSNLCFPIEALVFMALGVGVLLANQLARNPCAARHRTLTGTRPLYAANPYTGLMRRIASNMFVYGDDLICRGEDYASIVEYFPKVGLMFNTDKCCTQGSFRESCGVDAYKGIDVTPLKLKGLWRTGRKQKPETIISWVAFSNAIRERGYRNCASLMLEAVESRVGKLPTLPSRYKPLVVKHRDILQYGILAAIDDCSHVSLPNTTWQVRFNPDLQVREWKGLQAVPRKVTVASDDWSMVLRRHGSRRDARILSNEQHDDPGFFTVRRSVTLKRRWHTL